ncbi:tyrosine phosphatase family-domain-containing protein [Kockovaella imperatae]|uniref:Putative tyrosine-protein phosphatase OCA1 n=1 Tax=Kockovaella imperatae TaxID=4999 RepID=A0A1Y1UGN5_9TREE|nr:tyrosine phosphatase family-domain-containing protein [Kockovaella imperatae]ORX36687.1 tyrosine phosphatase family-domain-containing protein [Kockovaella imperatae]
MSKLTPPYYFSIVASCLTFPPPPIQSSSNQAPDPFTEVLYRGSIPLERNLSFVQQKRIKTLVYLSADEVTSALPLGSWAKNNGVETKWIKADVMGEEKLGIGKTEVGEVLKLILDRSMYPLYIADVDGISHTTLIVACLRKLQGWHMDSIIDEMCRYEPDHEDFSLVPFITSYLSSSDSTFTLPALPYPSWLWPSPTTTPVGTNSGMGIGAGTAAPPSASQAPSIPQTASQRRERDRTKSEPAHPKSYLPFPHPLQARRHPTMRLNYPAIPQGSGLSPLLPALNNTTLSRTSTRAEDSRTSPNMLGSSPHGISGAAVIELPDAIMGSPTSQARQNRAVNFSRTATLEPVMSIQSVMESPHSTVFSRFNTISSSYAAGSTDGEVDNEDNGSTTPEEVLMDGEYDDQEGQEGIIEEDDYEDEEEDDYDEDEDEQEEDEFQPQSQYISALDLAGFT